MNQWMRKLHRLASLLFTISALFVFFSLMGGEEPAEWIYMMPLPFLAFLWLSGTYLYLLPILARRRRASLKLDT